MRSPTARRTHAHPHHLLSLEPRTLLANTVVFTDEDGDVVTVKLTGPGTVTPELSGGGTGFITVLNLADTTEASALSISVKTPSGSGGDGRVVMQNMNDTSELKSFKAPTTDINSDAEIALTSITAFTIGNVGEDVTFNLTPPAGKPVAIVLGVFNGDISVEGRVASMRLTRSEASADVNVGGSIGPVRCSESLGGEWRADFFGNVTVADQLEARLITRTPDARGYTFGTIRAQEANAANLEDDNQSDYGRVRAIITEFDWNGELIDVAGIDTLRIGDDFRPGEMNLRDEDPDVFSIKNGFINDDAEDEWRLGSKVGTLRIGRVDELDVNSTSDNVHIGTLVFFQSDETHEGDWEVSSIRSLTAKGTLDGEIEVEGFVPGTDRSITTFKAEVMDDLEVEAEGGVGSLTANLINGCDVLVRYFGTVSVKSGAAGAGDLFATDLRANGSDAGGFSLRTLRVAGQSSDSTIMTRSDIKSLTFGRFFDTIVFAGHTNVDAFTHPAFGDLANFDATRSIGSFTVTQAFNAIDPALGNGVRVTAGTITKIAVNGFTNPDNGGNTHGFISFNFGSIKMKNVDGSSLNVVITVGGDINPFAPAASDFVFRQLT